jgi:hypothetical protein
MKIICTLIVSALVGTLAFAQTAYLGTYSCRDLLEGSLRREAQSWAFGYLSGVNAVMVAKGDRDFVKANSAERIQATVTKHCQIDSNKMLQVAAQLAAIDLMSR